MAKNVYGFEKKNSAKTITIIEIIVIAIVAIAIIAMLSFFFLFAKEGSHPKIFGYNFFLSDATNMTPEIPKDTLVLASPDEVDNLEIGNVVLCNLELDDDNLTTILRIQDIQLEEGTTYYILKGDTNSANETVRAPQANIIGKAIYSLEFFGKVITFATSQLGIIVGVIVPGLLFLLFQVLHIIRVNRYEDDDDDDDNDEDELHTDNIVYSTLKNKHDDFDVPQITEQQSPVKRIHIGDEGKAEYLKKAAPTAGYNELHETIRNVQQNNPMRTPTQASTNLNTQRSTVASNFKQKPGSRDAESALEMYFERPVKKYPDQLNESTYDRPKLYYEKPVSQQLISPAVENPVDITIPTAAIMPRETIAPPPKRQNNKTVEELMRVIDQAQSGIKK